MPVQIRKAAFVHPAVVFGLAVNGTPGFDCFRDDFIDFLPALYLQRQQDFGGLLGIGNVFVRECLELLMRQEHGEHGVAYDHAGAGFIRELRVKGEPELCEKSDGFLEILNWQIDEYFGDHSTKSITKRPLAVVVFVRGIKITLKQRTKSVLSATVTA